MPSNNGYQPLTSHGHYHHRTGEQHSPIRNRQRPISVEDVCADGTPPPPLRMADRVVWLSDNGPEYGTVKWLGKLPDVGSEWMAGVDFINPVGSGTGLYNEHKLFETRMNHASLVPIVGLMKATDYLGSINVDEAVPPQKPRRTKQKSGDTFKFYTEKDSKSLTSEPKEECSKYTAQINMITYDMNNLKTVTDSSSSDRTETIHGQSSDKMLSGTLQKQSISVPIDSTQYMADRNISQSSHSSTSNENQCEKKEKLRETSPIRDDLFELGTVVEVSINSTSYYGVIRWLGFSKNNVDYGIDSIRMSEKNFRNVIAGIELEEEISGLTDGTLNGRRYFTCPINKAYFISLWECSKDRRFNSSLSSLSDHASTDHLSVSNRNSNLFGSIDCPTVLGDVAPLTSQEDLSRLCGKNRGIQGHHNSCYLDATLFAMFSSTTVFESLLYRPKQSGDIPEYNEVQRILKEEIVNPLRTNLYVRADRVMHLRQLLERISSVRGLTSEEKDPEEFLNMLLNDVLKTDPYLKLSSGLESSFYQLFVEKDENLQMPNVQQLFDQSFLASDIKLREIPPCLLIQMPRFGREFKMYPRIMPTLYLDITNVLENSPRQCIVCGELAEYECKECFGKFGDGLESIAFCAPCLDKSHSHKKRSKHKAAKLVIPNEFAMLKNHTNIPRVVMELFAVLCIETSHYVSFVKCGPNPDSPWCFFDSMADRKGEQNGYNIPEVVSFPDLRWWLSADGCSFLLNNKDDKMIPELPRRLVSDAYICFYSSEVLRYR